MVQYVISMMRGDRVYGAIYHPGVAVAGLAGVPAMGANVGCGEGADTCGSTNAYRSGTTINMSTTNSSTARQSLDNE